MNLIIDVGNSFVKLAVFQKNRLKSKDVVTYDAFEKKLQNILEKYSIDKAIMSSVGNFTKEQLGNLEQTTSLHILSHKSQLPFKNLYKTPKTLGVDRIALVSAAVKKYHSKDVLVIDAGTCITYDFVSANKTYYGGSISPGIRLRYKTLNTLTARLPLLDTKSPKNIVGASTDEAIHSGVVYGVINEIDGVINTYCENSPDLTVILTGGDAKFLSTKLKSTIFAISNFLLEGLNYILQHNSH